MRRTLLTLFAGFAMLAISAADLQACGDKYLSVGRGARFQRGYVSLHPVNVAVYRSKVTGSPGFLSRLKIAGHKVTVTDDAKKLEQMLTSGQYEVVLAGYENASMVEGLLMKQTNRPTFLPVVEEKSAPATHAAKKYGCVLNAAAGKKQKNFLAVLDDAVEARMKAQPIICTTEAM